MKYNRNWPRLVGLESQTLPEFNVAAESQPLSIDDRLIIINQALVLLRENYVHLLTKRSMYSVDPVQALEVLRYRIVRNKNRLRPPDSAIAFHAEILGIFNSVRDLHTNYLLPPPFRDHAAVLPFALEEYFVKERDGNHVPRYLVAHTSEGFSHDVFKRGVDVVSWNGIPIERAITLNSDRTGGGNPAARRSRGLQYLTQRPLIRSLPPDEEWVEVGFIDLQKGKHRTIRFFWRVIPVETPTDNPTDPSIAVGMDIEMEVASSIKRILFARHTLAALPATLALARPETEDGVLTTTMAKFFKAQRLSVGTTPVGHLRIYSFMELDHKAFLSEAVRLIRKLPQTLLIIDVRANGGGNVAAAEGLLELLLPGPVEPEPAQFRITELNKCIVHIGRDTAGTRGWLGSMIEAVITGAAYSVDRPLSSLGKQGQVYRGRVIVITDARSYSATDIFAAGIEDHGGYLLGVDETTGAGGASVLTHAELMERRAGAIEGDPCNDAETPYRALPMGTGMRVAIQRTMRVRFRAGELLEDFGVDTSGITSSGARYYMTRDDLINGNKDLINNAVDHITLHISRPARLDLTVVAQTNTVGTVIVDTQNVSRIDIFVDGRPYCSRDVDPRGSRRRIRIKSRAGRVRVEGWDGDDPPELKITNHCDLSERGVEALSPVA